MSAWFDRDGEVSARALAVIPAASAPHVLRCSFSPVPRILVEVAFKAKEAELIR